MDPCLGGIICDLEHLATWIFIPIYCTQCVGVLNSIVPLLTETSVSEGLLGASTPETCFKSLDRFLDRQC